MAKKRKYTPNPKRIAVKLQSMLKAKIKKKHLIYMEYFTQGYTQPLRDGVSASTKTYLTTGIKEAVIEQLTF